jgi:hypothetical protein
MTTAAVFQRGGSPAVDRRWGNSFRGSRQFSKATWRELGWPEARVPMENRDGGEEEFTGAVVRLRGCEGIKLNRSGSFSGLRRCRWGTGFSVQGGGGG